MSVIALPGRWKLRLVIAALSAALFPGCTPAREAAPTRSDAAPAPAAAAISTAQEPEGAHLTLVKNATAQATIVVAKEALTAAPDPKPEALGSEPTVPEKIASAARDLQLYIQKMSGAKLPIVGDDQAPKTGPLILVGRSALTKPWDAKIPAGRTAQFAEEGYLILAKGDRLLLAGNDGINYHGTEYAVAGFLHRQGVRWYMPGEFGDFVPKQSSVYAPEMEVLSRPDFKMRNWGGPCSAQAAAEQYRWKIRNGLNPQSGTTIELPADTSVRSVLPPTERAKDKEMVDIFGKQENGQPAEGMPNLTSLRSVAYAADKIKEAFRKDPKMLSYGIAPDDGMPRDFTPSTLKLNLGFPDVYGKIGVPADMSGTEEWMQWVEAVRKEVAKEFPDRLITTNGYSNRNTPPFGVDFDPNTPIMFAAIWSDTMHAFDNPRSWQMERQGQMLKRWGELSKNVFMYNYTYYMLASAGTPIPLSRKHAHDMPLYKKWHIIGFANEGRYVAAEQGVFPPYYQARAMWDAGLDREAEASEFFANWYGPAAGPARQFWEALENAMETTDMVGHEDRVLPFVYSPALLAELDRHVSDAEKLATGDWSKSRVLADRLILNHLKGYLAMQRAEFAADFAEAARQVDYMLEQRKPLFKLSRSYFDVKEDTGDSWGYYYWGVVERRDYYRKLADLTTGKTGTLVAVLPEQARFRLDPRDEGRFAGWDQPTLDEREWTTAPTTAPFYLQPGGRDAKGYPYMGALWYRLDVDVPSSAKGKKVLLCAPAVESEAWVWVNGRFIGHREYHDAYERPNPIDMDVTAALKPGQKNSVVVRVHTGMNPSAEAGGMVSRLFLYAPK